MRVLLTKGSGWECHAPSVGSSACSRDIMDFKSIAAPFPSPHASNAPATAHKNPRLRKLLGSDGERGSRNKRPLEVILRNRVPALPEASVIDDIAGNLAILVIRHSSHE